MTEDPDESSWSGAVTGRRVRPNMGSLRMVLQMWQTGVAGSFLAADQAGRRWWVKPPHQGELDSALVTEYVVGKLGHLIGAPTCENIVFEITADFERDEFAPGKFLRAGLGHATAEVVAAKEERTTLGHRHEDDNAVRHAGIFALYDWCWGSDEQWLISTTGENSTFSHDHGWYFPPPGPKWEVQALRDHVDEPHPLHQSATGLDPTSVEEVATSLESVTRDALAAILRQVPSEWPRTDDELEKLGWFLERRAPGAAARLRQLA